MMTAADLIVADNRMKRRGTKDAEDPGPECSLSSAPLGFFFGEFACDLA
jgi:hypothetical protein